MHDRTHGRQARADGRTDIALRRQGRVNVPPREQMLFWLLTVFLVFVALTGGSSRPDTLSLVVLRPVTVLVCAIAAWTISADHLRRYTFAFGLFTGVAILTIGHLVPLPPTLWQALPGRTLVVELDRAVGTGAVWRPISLAPADTRNALFSLFVPLAVLLVGAQLGPSMHKRLLLVLLCVAVGSAILGLLQIVGPPAGPLFLYAHTNYGTPTGLFANRNHQAIFLATALPMLAAFTTLRANNHHALRDAFAALAAGLFFVPLLLVVGSRAGFVIAIISLTSLPWLLRLPILNIRPKGAIGRMLRLRTLAIVLTVALVGLIAASVDFSRAVSVTRMFEIAAGDELRFKVWPVIVTAISTYFPIGTGIGVFVPIFQIAEPDAILRSTYLNHAHSEPLEIVLTAGLPGLLLLLAALIAWMVGVRRAFAGSDRDGLQILARLGLVVIGLLALGSIGDYPLRTPFMAALLALAGLWASDAGRQSAR